jgi:hypothetical protein
VTNAERQLEKTRTKCDNQLKSGYEVSFNVEAFMKASTLCHCGTANI